MSPQRIQLRRTKGWRMPAGVVIVDRRTSWGNPYVIRRAASRRDGPLDMFGIFVAHRRLQMPTWYEGPLVRWDTKHLAASDAVERYRSAVQRGWGYVPWPQEIRVELRGRDLACWCPLDAPCHADVLLDLANGGVS